MIWRALGIDAKGGKSCGLTGCVCKAIAAWLCWTRSMARHIARGRIAWISPIGCASTRAAQYEVEAWLLPYWEAICKRVGVHHAAPGPQPEQVDLNHPPSHRLEELYRLARPRRKYIKTIEMAAILQGKDLTIAADLCPEFKRLLNTLLSLGKLEPLP